MDIVIDTDVLSTFCKIDRLQLLPRLFRKSTIIVPPSVYKEIKQAVQGGKLHYSPPPRFSRATLKPSERKLAREIWNRKRLGLGDCECIAIAHNRKCILLTNDGQAQREADSFSIDYMNLPLILRELWITRLSSKDQILELATEIENKDSIRIKNLSSLLR